MSRDMITNLRTWRTSHSGRALGLHLLAVFCLLLATTVAVEHDHEDHQSHADCAVCHLSTGLKDIASPPLAVTIPVPVIFAEREAVAAIPVLAGNKYHPRTSRGPPLFLS